ncbi:MAG: hypothetical protein ACOYOV_00145 [Bacteroidales bacterium]
MAVKNTKELILREVIKLQKHLIEEIVEIIAEELDMPSIGLEENEVLVQLVSLSIALYLSKLNPENDKKGEIH